MGRERAADADKPRIVFGVDLGQSCGNCALAFNRDGSADRLESGTWDFKGHHGGGGIQGLRMERFLSDLIVRHRAKAVRLALAYEVVEFAHKSSAAARVYYGMMATLQTVCEKLGVPHDGIPPGTLKKGVTGHGNSSKEQVALVVGRLFQFEPRRCGVCRKTVIRVSATGRCPGIVEKGRRHGQPCPGWVRKEDESDAVGAALTMARQLGWWNGSVPDEPAA